MYYVPFLQNVSEFMSTRFGSYIHHIYTYLVQTDRQEQVLRAILNAKDTMSYDKFPSLALNCLEHRRCFT